MFVKILFKFILGYVRVSVEGYYIERFINVCKKKEIMIWNLKRKENVELSFNVSINDFRQVVKIAKKMQCNVSIVAKKGLPFLFNKYKKRKIFFLFLFVLIVLLVICSNFVWNVQIDVVDGEVLENIQQDIDECGLSVGKLKCKINAKEIINKVRLRRNDISWMGIEFKGTNAIVKVVKAVAKPDIVDENDFSSVVSDKEGVITKISAQNGTAAVNVGDTVKVGTPLIYGWMEGKYTGLRYVHATGEIEAKVWYTKKELIPFSVTEKRETGRKENKYKIKFNNFEINLSKRLSKFQIYDTIDAENKIRIFSDFYLPISLVKNVNIELEEYDKKYSVQEAKDLGIKTLQEKIDKQIADKEKIVNKVITTEEQEDGIEVIVTYEVLENLGTNEKIVF